MVESHASTERRSRPLGMVWTGRKAMCIAYVYCARRVGVAVVQESSNTSIVARLRVRWSQFVVRVARGRIVVVLTMQVGGIDNLVAELGETFVARLR